MQLDNKLNIKPANSSGHMSRLQLHITGAVQGVGFRPFIYNLAQELKLAGWVCNDIRGLRIEVEGLKPTLDVFIQRLQQEAPTIASIRQIEIQSTAVLGETSFQIVASENSAEAQPKPSVLPDLATCPDCLNETQDQNNRRYRYPFTSCTLCGPRWSIIEALPYDRPNTTMADFPLCSACKKEYTDPADRRFHHQTNTCPECGPQLALLDASGTTSGIRDHALTVAIDALKQGKIIALKGIGGFQLLVDAKNENAVKELRLRKQRPSKPFALLGADIDHIQRYCEVSEAEENILQAAAAPIVLLKKRTNTDLANAVAPGNPYLGMMLPASVLHHQLASEFDGILICTSGNLSGDPICKNNEEALQRLQNIADLYLLHNRPVVRALDDSVVQLIDGQISLLRRARGYAPEPVDSKLSHQTPAVLAVGAHIKNTIALSLPGENNTVQTMLSAHLGDLSAPGTRNAFKNRIDKYLELYRAQPELVVHDLHPDYYSTQYAAGLKTGKLAVQHHWAHIAACMAEHQLNDQVLGVAWDGVGLGDDGNAWGGEFMLADMQGYKRIGCLLPFLLPGGDKAAIDIRRSTLGVLYTSANSEPDRLAQWLPGNLFSENEYPALVSMLNNEINTVTTSSAGRLFDAVSCLLGLCQKNSFEGEAAMALQFAAECGQSNELLPLPISKTGGFGVLDWRPLVQRIVDGLAARESVNNLAHLFHVTLVKALVEFVVTMQVESVVLTGGCFQNRLLLQLALSSLQERQIKTYWPQKIPANDGGVAFGQAVIGLNSLIQ